MPLALPLLAAACSSGGGGVPPPPAAVPSTAFAGTLTGPAGELIEGATVYLVPAHLIDQTPITAADVLSGASETYDEPLEDLVAAAGADFDRSVTDGDGEFSIDDIEDGEYFVYVAPGAGDLEHLPGGDLCRSSLDAEELRGTTTDVELSSSASSSAVYVGMSTCLACHDDHATETQVAHRLGFRVPGGASPLQDLSHFPNADKGLDYFIEAAEYKGGTPVYHFNYDSSKGFDKYETSLTDPGEADFVLWTWKDSASGDYKITFDNVANEEDPNDLTTRVVQLTYGGSVFKQRYMIDWEDRNGLYPVLQFQHEGSDSKHDRSRRQFRDYHLDFYVDNRDTKTDTSDDLIQDPSVEKNISRNCMGCHGPNYTQFDDPLTGEVLCDTVEDPFGEYDIDGDGFLNDLNTGCESCHGPGSQHIANMAAEAPRWILNACSTSAQSRQVMVCARCHDRQIGNGTVKNDHPLNPADEFPDPGISASGLPGLAT